MDRSRCVCCRNCFAVLLLPRAWSGTINTCSITTDAMMTTKVVTSASDTGAFFSADDIAPIVMGTTTDASAPMINHTNTTIEKPVWTRLKFKGIYHDNRRLLTHRAKNCECHICYREIYKLPPAESQREYVAAVKSKKVEREIKKAKKKARKDVKVGRQRSIDAFFGYPRA